MNRHLAIVISFLFLAIRSALAAAESGGMPHTESGGMPHTENGGVPRGVELCKRVENILIDEGLHTVRHPLLQGNNVLPYNVTAAINSGTGGKPFTAGKEAFRTAIFIAVKMEDALKKEGDIKEIIRAFKEEKEEVVLLFTYSDDLPYKGAMLLKGTEAFMQEIGGEDIAALCLSWEREKESGGGSEKTVHIINGGGGGTAPAQMLRLICKALAERKIPYMVEAGSFGALYRMGALRQDERVASFISAMHSACGMKFYTGISGEDLGHCLTAFVHYAHEDDITKGGMHYALFQTKNHFFIMDERYIVLLFIAASFLCTLFVCLPSSREKTKAVQIETFRYLPFIPATLAATTFSLIIGQKAATISGRHLSLLSLSFIKLSIAFIVITALYCLSVCLVKPLGNSKEKMSYGEESYCYLLLCLSLINMLIFAAVDISSVFLFSTEYVIALIARKVRSLPLLIITGALMFLPYLPYILVLSRYAEDNVLKRMFYSTAAVNAFFAFVFLPHLMQWLRILSRVFVSSGEVALTPAQKAAKTLHTLRSALSAFMLSSIVIIAMIGILQLIKATREKDAIEVPIKMKEARDGLLVCTVHDDTFFDDTLRTIKIDSGEPPCEIVTEITGEKSSTILYCDDFYMTNEKSRTDTFRLPAYPPKHITQVFSVDASQSSVIKVTAIYDSGVEGIYTLRRSIIKMEGKDE